MARRRAGREARTEAVSTVRVPLNEEQRITKGLEMARELQVIAGLEDEKKRVTSNISVDLKAHKATVKKLAEELVEGAEIKAQKDLTFEEQKAADEQSPKQALHDVAAHAGEKSEEEKHLDQVVAASAVDVGTVKEPASIEQHRSRRRQRLSENA